MNRSKKLLSLLLCVAMLFSTLAIALTVSAEEAESTIMSYADLDAAYDNFVYVAAEFYDADGNRLPKNAEVVEGQTITCKVYYKTDYTMYNNQQPTVVFDKTFFNVAYDKAGTYRDCQSTAATVKAGRNFIYVETVEPDPDADPDTPEYDGYEIETLPEYLEGIYTVDQVKNMWTGIQINPAYTSTAKTIDGVKYAKNQSTANFKSDEPLATFTVTVKDEASLKGVTSGFAKVYAEMYSCYAGDANAACKISIGAATTTGAKKKADYTLVDCDYTFSINNDKTVKFMDGDTQIGETATVAKGSTLTADQIPDTSAVEDFYTWADAQGNILSNVSALEIKDNTVIYAVKSTKEVEVTLDLNGATIEEVPEGVTYDEAAGTLSFTAPITGADISAIVPVKEGVSEFAGWQDDAGNTWDGTFNKVVDSASYKAAFGTGIVIKVLPVDYETVEVEEEVAVVDKDNNPVYDEENNPVYTLVTVEREVWVDAFTYYATGKEPGDSVTKADLIDIQKAINNHYDEIEEIVIPDALRNEDGTPKVDLQFETNGAVSKKMDTAKEQTGYFGPSISSNLQGKYLGTSTYTFGETITTLYVNTAITYNVEYYKPTFDTNGVKVEDESQPFGLSWASPVKSSATFKARDLSTKEYTVDANKATVAVNTPYANAAMESSLAASLEGKNIGRLKTADLAFDYDTYTYKVTYRDISGNKYSASDYLGYKAINVDPEKPDTIKVYATLDDRTYHIGYMIDGYVYASDQTFVIGDEITADKLDKVARTDYVIDNAFSTHIINTEDLYLDGTPVDKKGYSLINIYYTGASGEQLSITDGETVVIDKAFVDAYTNRPNADDKEDVYLALKTEWSGKDYTFNVYYQNAKEEWVLAETKVISGSDRVEYNTVIGAGSELDKKIKADHPSNLVPAQAFSLEKGGAAVAINAYDADNETNTLDIYLTYTGATRYAFVDYNNGLNEAGEINEDKTGEGTRYQALSLMYGATLYDPDYDPESGDSTPAFYSYTSTFSAAVSTLPEQTQQKDDDGNPKYEPQLTEAKDEDGNVILNADGTPKMVPMYDEEGKIVYDKTQPIMTDPKGDCIYRPFRNTEFAGFKVYYVDGLYTSFADLPDQKEWKEGYNDQNEKGAQHLYTTTILQVQWISDADLKYRVYDDCNKLSFAKTTSGKKLYWDMNGNPCNKGENVVVEPTTRTVQKTVMNEKGEYETVTEQITEKTSFLLFFKITKEEGYGTYFTAISLSKDFLNLTTTTGYVPVILSLVKGLIK